MIFWQYGWLGMLNDPSAKIKLVLGQSMTHIIFSSFSGSLESKIITKGYNKWKQVKFKIVGKLEKTVILRQSCEF